MKNAGHHRPSMLVDLENGLVECGFRGPQIRTLLRQKIQSFGLLLKLGQRLVIWSKSRNLASRQFVSLPHSVTQQQVHYRVRKGDSLARIAQKFSVTVSKLRRWNSLKKGKYLQPGQRLTLYVDVTQQS